MLLHRIRDAITGRFTTAAEAERHPQTTVRETVADHYGEGYDDGYRDAVAAIATHLDQADAALAADLRARFRR